MDILTDLHHHNSDNLNEKLYNHYNWWITVFGFTRFFMVPEISCDRCYVTAPSTTMNLWLLLMTNFGRKNFLVELPLMSIQVSLTVELFSTILNITEELLVRHHVCLKT